MPFVPRSFDPPAGLDHPLFRLRPLGPEHNESDYAAWSSSIAHIRATPGFEGLEWPHPMTLDENRRDLVRHAEDFAARTGFTYTVLAPADEDGPATVIGCVYIYPGRVDPASGAAADATPDATPDASVRSWVRAADAALDPVLYEAVAEWLADVWPFERVSYAARSSG